MKYFSVQNAIYICFCGLKILFTVESGLGNECFNTIPCPAAIKGLQISNCCMKRFIVNIFEWHVKI